MLNFGVQGEGTMGKVWSWEIFRHAFMFFPRLTAKNTFIAFPNKKDTQRDLIYVYVYIIYTVYIYIYICFTVNHSIYLSKQWISVVTFITPNPYLQIHINITFRKFLHATHPALRMSARVSLKCFNQRASKRRISFVATCYVVLEVSENLCFSGARFAEPNVPLGTRDFAGCLGMMIIDLVKF